MASFSESGTVERCTDGALAERWRRDRPLFNVASKPREIRAQRAWQALDALKH